MAHSRSLTTTSEADYDVIEGAVMETARGRWFLAEFARRNRHADTGVLLEALGRIEGVVTSERSTAGIDRLRGDLLEMAKAIARTKTEIAALHAPDHDQSRLGAASQTLDGITRETERATSEILEAAEQIQETAWTLRESGEDDRLCDELDRRATQIYTACSFQDLTAQRTGRIVSTLRYLETRLTAMIEIWGDDAAEAPAPEAPEAESVPDLSQSDVDLVIDTGGGFPETMPNEAPARAGRARAAAPLVADPLAVAEDDLLFVDDAEPAPAAPEPRPAATVTPLSPTQPLAAAFADLDGMSDAEKLIRFS